MLLTWIGLAFAAAAAGIVFTRAARVPGGWTRGSIAVPVLLVFALGLFFQIFVKSPFYGLDNDWNGARLAPVVSMTKGYALYYPPGEGPMLSWIYGPLGALMYLPVAPFGDSDTMIVAGLLLAQLYVVVPLFLCHWRVRGEGGPRRLAVVLAFLMTFLALSLRYGTRYWYEKVHADAPALGFGLLSCMFLLSASGPPSRRSLILSALFASLSLFCKQTEIGVPLGLVLFVALAHGRGPALRAAAWIAGICAGLGLLALGVFGGRALWHNMITIPAGHPWQKPGLQGLLWSAGILLEHGWPALLILLPGFVTAARNGRAAAARPWMVFFSVALAMVPTSILGQVKAGGETSSLHALLFLYAAASLSLVDGLAEAPEGKVRTRAQVVAAAVMGLLLAAVGYQMAAQTLPAEAFLADNVFRQADRLSRSRPGEIYFPSNPLSTLVTEGKAYHFDYGVFDRCLAGHSPSPGYLRAHLPPNLRVIAWFHFPPRVMGDLLPEFSARKAVVDPAMPQWTIYAASP